MAIIIPDITVTGRNRSAEKYQRTDVIEPDGEPIVIIPDIPGTADERRKEYHQMVEEDEDIKLVDGYIVTVTIVVLASNGSDVMKSGWYVPEITTLFPLYLKKHMGCLCTMTDNCAKHVLKKLAFHRF